MPASEAFCPAGISSFFEICNADSSGNPLSDAKRIGARGGGFAIARGIKATVVTRKSPKTRIRFEINAKSVLEAPTTASAINKMLADARISLDVLVKLEVAVPIGAGYGTSAAGTLASCLALADAAHIPITLNELATLVHVAEVENQTGLGTASPLVHGGFVLVIEPGAPGFGFVDRLIFPENHSIICAYLGPTSTRNVLGRSDITAKVNPAAQRTMRAIRSKPDLHTFLTEARAFSEETGFQTPEIARLMEAMISAGSVGAAQNMLGKAVHGVAENSKVPRILLALRKTNRSAKVFATKLDDRGVRLV